MSLALTPNPLRSLAPLLTWSPSLPYSPRPSTRRTCCDSSGGIRSLANQSRFDRTPIAREARRARTRDTRHSRLTPVYSPQPRHKVRPNLRLGSLPSRRFFVLDEDTRAHCAPYTADDFDAIASTFASTRLRDAGFRVLNNAA